MHRTHQVHIDHQFEIGNLHLGEALVTQDAGVVHQDIDAAPGVHGLLHHGLHRHEVGHGRAVGNRLAARCSDLVDYGLRRADGPGAGGAIPRTAQVINQHAGATRRQCERMLASQSAAGASNDGHTAGEIESHESLSTKKREQMNRKASTKPETSCITGLSVTPMDGRNDLLQAKGSIIQGAYACRSK